MSIYILGAGAMAREVLVYYKHLGKAKEVRGFIEEHSTRVGHKIHGIPIFDSSIVPKLPKDNVIFIGAMGSPLRYRWISQLENEGYSFDTLIHPNSLIGDNVKIGMGSIIGPGVIITCDVNIGKHVIINIGSTINHDVQVGDFVTISPGVSIAGNVVIGNRSFIGIGAKIANKVNIGEGVFIGAGAVVTKDIPDNVLAVGVPAKPIRKLSKEDWRRLI